MKHIAILLAVALLVSGCSKWRDERYAANCQELGFQPDTSDMGYCILAMRQERAQRGTAAAVLSQPSPYIRGTPAPY